MNRRHLTLRGIALGAMVLITGAAQALDDAGAKAVIDRFLSTQKLEMASAEPMQHVVTDLDGDGRPDIVLVWNVMGATWFYPKLSIFLDQGKTYRTLTADLTGQPDKLTVKGSLIVVDTLTLGPKDPRCCPTVKQQLRYRWAGGKLTKAP